MRSRALIGAHGKIMPPRRIATAQSFSERKICAAKKLLRGIVFRRVQKKKMLQRARFTENRPESCGNWSETEQSLSSSALECKAASSSAARKFARPTLVR
jgi:hypothetical protein